MNDKGGAATQPVVIKKYANRRLYNTSTSSYVTLDDLEPDGEAGKPTSSWCSTPRPTKTSRGRS